MQSILKYGNKLRLQHFDRLQLLPIKNIQTKRECLLAKFEADQNASFNHSLAYFVFLQAIHIELVTCISCYMKLIAIETHQQVRRPMGIHTLEPKHFVSHLMFFQLCEFVSTIHDWYVTSFAMN